MVLATSLITTVVWGPSPVGRSTARVGGRCKPTRVKAVNDAAIREVPPNAAVSASYIYIPHLAHRVKVYEFPVPWRDINWGVNGEHLDDPDHVQWIVVDSDLLDADGESVLNALLQLPVPRALRPRRTCGRAARPPAAGLSAAAQGPPPAYLARIRRRRIP